MARAHQLKRGMGYFAVFTAFRPHQGFHDSDCGHSPTVEASLAGASGARASGASEMAQSLPTGKEVCQPAVITHDPINDPPSRAYDLRRDEDDRVQETPELHLH